MNAKWKYFKMKNRSTVLCKSVLFTIKLKFKCFRLVKTFKWSWLVYRWECSISQTFGNNKALDWTWWLRLCMLNQYSSKETNGYAFLCFKFLLSHLYSFVITSVRTTNLSNPRSSKSLWFISENWKIRNLYLIYNRTFLSMKISSSNK